MTTFTFESETCSRCGGTGEFSYCQMYGTRCFKCSGAKITLTKRGTAAQKFFNDLCSKQAGELKVGDKIWVSDVISGKAGWSEVIFVGFKANCGGYYKDGVLMPHFIVETKACEYRTFENKAYRVAQSKEDKAAKLAAALEYQASLTKAGTPRKTKVA